MRIFFAATTLVICLVALPLMAKTFDNARLQSAIEQALNTAAATGDESAVTAKAQDLAAQYPSFTHEIATYVQTVAQPAARVMAVVGDMSAEAAPQSEAGQEEDVASLAAELNAMDVGAGQ